MNQLPYMLLIRDYPCEYLATPRPFHSYYRVYVRNRAIPVKQKIAPPFRLPKHAGNAESIPEIPKHAGNRKNLRETAAFHHPGTVGSQHTA